MKNYKDIVSGIIIIASSVFYLICASTIHIFSGSGTTAINSRTIPTLWGCCLLVLGIAMIIRYFIHRNQILPEEDSIKVSSNQSTIQSWRIQQAVPLSVILLLGYVLLMKRIGFTLTTLIYLFCQSILLSPKGKIRYGISAALSIVFSIGIYEIFVRFLNVPLPAGIFSI